MRLQDLAGWVFDLDGVIWSGRQAIPGARELVATLRETGRRVVFLSNNSTASRQMLAERLRAHGIAANPEQVISPMETAARQLRERFGSVRVLVVGAEVLRAALEAEGHTCVDDPMEAEAVVMGRDETFDYHRLTQTCRAVERGIPYITLNVDARLPIEDGQWLPGVGALVAAVEAVTGRYPEVVGKPSPLLFKAALAAMGTAPADSVMVGDTRETDIAGGRQTGMWTIQVGQRSGKPEPHLQVATPAELLQLWRDGARIG
ncbi:MAG TPA: HAD-IIA family hydrolase [Symbiobacteriaceae bacterium]